MLTELITGSLKQLLPTENLHYIRVTRHSLYYVYDLIFRFNLYKLPKAVVVPEQTKCASTLCACPPD